MHGLQSAAWLGSRIPSGLSKDMFEFVCDVMPAAAGEHADMLCAAVLAKSRVQFSKGKASNTPLKVTVTVHVADDMGSEATLKIRDSNGNSRASGRLGVTTIDRKSPSGSMGRLADRLLADLQQ